MKSTPAARIFFAAVSGLAFLMAPLMKVEAANEITFDEALARILSRSTAIATQQAGYGVLRSQDLPIRMAFVPSLSFNAKQTTTGGQGIDPAYDTRQLQGVAQMNLFRWGADVKNWQAASSDEASQRAVIEDAYLRSQDGGVAALINYIQRGKEIGVNESIVKMREDSLTVARERYSGGYLPLQEMQKVEVDLANANAQLSDAQVASFVAASALENLMGDTHVVTEWPWKDRFVAMASTKIPNPANDTQLAELLSKRPDWVAAEAKVSAEDSRLSRDWRLLSPSLDGQFTYGYYSSDQTSGYGETGIYGGPQWQGTLQVQFPLFDHLVLYSNARAQAFVKGQAEIAFEQVRRDARSEWDSARQTFAITLGSAQVRDKTLAISRKLYQDNLQRLRGGRINADDLVLEQRRLYESELLAVQGWAAVHLAYSKLCKAQGLRLQDCHL